MKFLVILILSFLNCSPSTDCDDLQDVSTPKIEQQIDMKKEPFVRLVREGNLYNHPLYYDKELDFYCQQEGNKCLPLKLETKHYEKTCQLVSEWVATFDIKYVQKISYQKFSNKFYKVWPPKKLPGLYEGEYNNLPNPGLGCIPVYDDGGQILQPYVVVPNSNQEVSIEIFAEIK